MPSYRTTLRLAAVWLAASMAGCGGGGGGGAPASSAPPAPAAPPASNWIAGSFLPAASHAGRCMSPRSGTDPATGLPYIDIQGTTLDENNWLRSWSNDLYLWYDEIVDRDPGLYTTATYFDLLKTTATTPSGRPKDRFHFKYPSSEWLALIQSGEQVGYGAVWSVRSTTNPPEAIVAYVEPDSQASFAGVRRGDTVTAVDGIEITSLNTETRWNSFFAGLFPATAGERHLLTLLTPLNRAVTTVSLQAATVTSMPVRTVQPLDTPTGRVGYIQFNDHIATAESQLIDAFTSLAVLNVSDLILDVRYNGGGFLAIASEVAYMIAGAVPTAGRVFEQLQFSDKHRSINPVTGGALTPLPFFDTSSSGQPLPTLNLSRVYVLTGSMTCSASESIINGLRGVGVEVIQIGSTTCGKPYGFYAKDNCGTTYFTVQFQGVNAAGFGSYGDGFSPQNTMTARGEALPGCSVRDDFDFELGDPLEARVAAALEYRRSQTCPAPSGASASGFTKPTGADVGAASFEGVVAKPLWLMNRWLEAP
jgi:carboxyl-terminal processing protease